MCLTTEQIAPLTVDEDITIYKLVYTNLIDDRMYTLFRDSVVELGKTYISSLSIEIYDSGTIVVERGLHAYFDKNKAVTYFSTLRSAHPIAILKGRIPEGSMYFKDDTGEIASNKIIYDDVLIHEPY